MSQTPPSLIERLISLHADKAYALSLRLCGNEADACDLAQESFLRAWKKAGLYDPAHDFGAWLHRLIYRVYLNERRSRSRRRELPLEGESPDEGSTPRAFPDREPGPEPAIEKREAQDRVREALSRLPAELKACVSLVDIDGLSYEEAARTLGWPVGSVAGRLFRARKTLRELLREEASP